MNTNYNDILCEAIGIVVDGKLNNITYDKTVICTIVDNSKKDEGYYTVVTEENVKFDAISESNKYKVDDQVYVTIPQGDYSKQKVIISKYTAEDRNKPVRYASPLETVVPMTNNLMDIIEVKEVGIIANKDISKEVAVIDLTDKNLEIDVQNNNIFNTLGISAKFKTLFGNKNVVSGNYGLYIVLDCTLLDGSAKILEAEFDVDSNDMYGDVYNFTSYFTQEKKIDISNLSKIKTIKMWLREDSNFYYMDGNIRKKLPTTKIVSVKNAEGKIERKEESILPNIFVSDIQLFFGNDIVKIEDDTFSIYSNNPLKYSAEKVKEDPTYNTKDLYSIWYNKDNESSEFIGFTDGSPLLDENNNDIYDEDAYQEELNTSMKGISVVIKPEDGNIPKLRQGLQIYANAYDMNTQFQLLFQKVNRELSYCISELDQLLKANQIEDINSLIQEAKELMESTTAAIEACATLDDESLNVSIQKKYISWLQYYGGFYDILKEDLNASIEKPEEIQKLLDDIKTLYDYYTSQWTELKNKLKEIYETQVMQILYNKYALMRYDFTKHNNIYKQRLEACQKHADKIDIFQESQKILCPELDSRLTNENTDLRNIELFEVEYQKFVEKYKNKYCIYWYRYNTALLNSSTDDRYLGAPWERIDLKGYTTKPGMPTVLLDKTYSKKSEVGLTGLEMDCGVEAEKFKAVLFFNHQEYWSNELVFENESPIASATQSNALYIELGEHAADSFPLYGLNNELNPADSGRLRELRVRYNGLLEKDELLKNAWVYWYIPENSTMLICPDSELLNQGFTYLDPDNPLYLENHLPYHKDKFKCYFKQMGSEEVLNEESELIETVKTNDTKFYFQISKLYRSSAMNNTIYCRVVKEEDLYETSRQFSFGYFGTAGTQYTLSITPAEDSNQYALINVDDEPYPLELQARFSNYNNREVPDDEAPTISWGWIKPHKLTTGLDIIENGRGKNYRSISGTLSIGSPPQCLYNVLECTAKWQHISTDLETGTEHYADEPITLKAYYPIPFSSGHYYVDCPTIIVYNDIGKINTTNYNTKLKIYDSTTSAEIKNVKWKMNYYNSGGIAEEPEFSAKNFLPVIKKVYSDTEAKYEYIFIAKETYISNPTLFPVAMCYHEDGSFLWAQPILLMQSAYGSNILNNWDEKLTIDEKKGIILSTAIAAGTKDESNQFHGVIMGYVDAITTEGNDLLTQSGISGFGLYGLNANAPSFGFTEDGTGFIGKSGSGRLIFDGENAEIKSSSRELTGDEAHPYGMLLKFNEGVFDILGSQNSRITIQEDDPYLKIKSINGTVLMEVGDSDYYLQTDNFSNSGLLTAGRGFKLDLKNNRLTGYDFDLEAKSADGKSYIKLGIEDGDEAYPYLKVHYTDDDAWGQDLLVIDKNQYFLQSHNYDTDKHTGIRFDLLNGFLMGYDFTLYAQNSLNQYIRLSSDFLSDPITVYGGPVYSDGEQVNIGLFRVGWDGSMNCGGHFRIDKDGTMYSTRAYVGGWKVGPTSISAGGTTLGSNGNITNGSISISSGNLTGATITDSTLNNLTVNGTLTIPEGGSFTIDGPASFTNNVNIAGTLSLPEDGQITIGGQALKEYVEENASLFSFFDNADFSLFGDTFSLISLFGSKGYVDKLGTSNGGYSVGSGKIPVYFSEGVPVACTTTFASMGHSHVISYTTSTITITDNAGNHVITFDCVKSIDSVGTAQE